MKDFTARQVGHGRPLSSKHAVMTFYDEAGRSGVSQSVKLCQVFQCGRKDAPKCKKNLAMAKRISVL